MNKSKLFAAALLLVGLTACNSGKTVDVEVSNTSEIPRTGEMVELPASEMLQRLGSRYCYVTAPDGKELPSQITSDSLLIFQADVPAGETATYTLHASDSPRAYAPKVSGRIYPERADDIAYENELVGFRIYGPATQIKGEKAFGYDIFLKHPTEEQIVEKLYRPETDPATWAKVDSLRKISDQAAEDFISTFSYHKDHGLGMDCYAVGPTLGAGVAVPFVGDSLSFSWCYKKAEVLDNGPLRFTVRLDFAHRPVGDDPYVIEHRLITLDAGSHLNRTTISYDGLSKPVTIAAGFPLRDDSAPVTTARTVAYADPTQGPDNGKVLLGIISAVPFDTTLTLPAMDGSQPHILGLTAPTSAPFTYYWGFAWDRVPLTLTSENSTASPSASSATLSDSAATPSDSAATPVVDMAAWTSHLASRAAALASPLQVKY